MGIEAELQETSHSHLPSSPLSLCISPSSTIRSCSPSLLSLSLSFPPCCQNRPPYSPHISFLILLSLPFHHPFPLLPYLISFSHLSPCISIHRLSLFLCLSFSLHPFLTSSLHPISSIICLKITTYIQCNNREN